MSKSTRVTLHDRLIDTHAGVVVDIAWLRQADDGVNQHVLRSHV